MELNFNQTKMDLKGNPKDMAKYCKAMNMNPISGAGGPPQGAIEPKKKSKHKDHDKHKDGDRRKKKDHHS